MNVEVLDAAEAGDAEIVAVAEDVVGAALVVGKKTCGCPSQNLADL